MKVFTGNLNITGVFPEDLPLEQVAAQLRDGLLQHLINSTEWVKDTGLTLGEAPAAGNKQE